MDLNYVIVITDSKSTALLGKFTYYKKEASLTWDVLGMSLIICIIWKHDTCEVYTVSVYYE